MAAAVDTDIDAFIREQKQKLASERQALHRYQGVKSRPDSDSLYREEWAKKHPESNGVEHPAAEVTPRRTKSKLEGGISSPDYRQRWQEVHGKQSPEKRSRRKWDVPEHPFSESVLLRDVHADHQTLQQPRRPDNSTLREFRQEGKRSHRETAEEIASLPFGEHEDKRKALAAERRQDYSEMLKKQTGRQNANLVRQTDEYKANFPGMNESDNAKIEKVRERNKEYNEFLREKNPQRGRPRFEDQTAADPGIYATLPGLRYSDSASKRRIEERNREYNEYLRNKEPRGRQSAFGDADIGRPPPAPRKGWATPTYEDMLNKKRQQEQQYRQVNDPVPLKSYGSEGGLNNFELDSRLWELDKELEAKKIRFQNERLSQSILDDPTWLSPRRAPLDNGYREVVIFFSHNACGLLNTISAHSIFNSHGVISLGLLNKDGEVWLSSGSMPLEFFPNH